MPSSPRHPAGRGGLGLVPKATEALHAGVNLLSVTGRGDRIVVAFFVGARGPCRAGFCAAVRVVIVAAPVFISGVSLKQAFPRSSYPPR